MKLLNLIMTWLSSLFKKQLPHPEEPVNHARTLENADVYGTVQAWLENWSVPAENWDFWRSAIDMQVYDVYPDFILAMGVSQDTPAATWAADGKRHMAIKAKWLNPGVIAHEQAHNSYSLLTDPQRVAFEAEYTPLIKTDSLIVLLYSKNQYGLSGVVEGHAEVYRYLGQKMPATLKKYYPELFTEAACNQT